MDSNWLLQYPVWELHRFGGGFWIALMATIHVYVAHFAVGGGLFLVLTEMKAYREKSEGILEYTRKHTKFFLLLTVVFGSITGVGIWFVISLLSPAATSTLIHQFVFAWATEWTFFVGEIITLFVYFYKFGKMAPKDHLRVGWIYFAFGWLSLLVINGILSFMLTPGNWLATGNFLDGFINPSFISSTFFRTAMSFMLAGLFGFVTAVCIKPGELRDNLMRYCARWLIFPLFFVIIFGIWYLGGLPEPQKSDIWNRYPETIRFIRLFMWLSPLLFIAGLLMTRRVSPAFGKAIAVMLLFTGLTHLGAFEFVREAGRRPYIIYNYAYTNSARAADMKAIQEKGLLKSARWVENREITDKNRMDAGREIFRLACSSCHSINGPMNDILPLTGKYTVFGMEAMLSGMGKISSYMPEFMGNTQERAVLAEYIVKELNGKTGEETPAEIAPITVEIPSFDLKKDEYLLSAWSGRGMYCFSDNYKYFSFAAPGNDIYALLIHRGEIPEKITENVKITYQMEDGFGNPSEQVDFWKYSLSLAGKAVPADTGLTRNKNSGAMSFDADADIWEATAVPVVPYKTDGSFMPYPLMVIEARDPAGNLLAATKITAPVSTEMNCRQCHGGKWRKDGKAGIADRTAEDILAVHDRLNRTDLLKQAKKGKPPACQSCHNSENGESLNLSAAIHGFHAVYLGKKGAKACASCHPGWPTGMTKAFRGIHQEAGLDCTSCHGAMEDHALSLLRAEAEKESAAGLMRHIKPAAVASVAEIMPRKPWINQPDCLNCHVNFGAPDQTETFNQWTASETGLYRNRTGEAGIRCMACHGSTHAIYPARNPFGNERDNIVPMQYQQMPYPLGANRNCKVCHTVDMTDEMHHPNSLGMFRNTR